MLFKNKKLVKIGVDKVNLPNGEKSDIAHIREALVFQDETMKNMLFVANFILNLLLVSKVQRKLSYFVFYHADEYVFNYLCKGRVKGIGREKGGLYILKSECWVKIEPGGQENVVAGLIIHNNNLWNKKPIDSA